MSRSGYTDDSGDNWALIRWRGMVASAIRGRRGQAFLRSLRDALDSLPSKRLVRSEEYEIVNESGDCCALGAVALAREWGDAAEVDSSDHEALGERLDIASCLVQEIEWENDGMFYRETPGERWKRLRQWADGVIA